MKNVLIKSWIIFAAITLVASGCFAQTSDKLKKEQELLEKKIAVTKSLLDKTKTNTASSLNELKVIQNQISFRERLLKNYDDQIRGAELTVREKDAVILKLKEKVEALKIQYKKLLLYAYKHRNKYGKVMYIFASDSYNEARKRNKYLKRIAALQQKQFLVIRQNQKLIKEEIAKIQDEKQQKIIVLSEKKKERLEIEKDREKKEEVYQKFREEEEKLLAKLRQEEKEKELLRSRINAAIQKEIAEAEARRKKEEAAALAAAKAKEAKESTVASEPKEATTTSKPSIVLEETKEAAVLSKSFEGNKGKLPWPVATGTITENFGTNPHPTLKNVSTNNRGIDISAGKNAQVRAVFDGEVTSVLNIPGAGKVVIIKHGNYRTVYSNLQDTYVSIGSKVSTKKIIGSLLTKPNESFSVVHFEIHKVEGSNVICLNPTLWVAQ